MPPKKSNKRKSASTDASAAKDEKIKTTERSPVDARLPVVAGERKEAKEDKPIKASSKAVCSRCYGVVVVVVVVDIRGFVLL